MAWVLVIAAGLLETVFAISLKLSDGFSRHGWTAAFVLAAIGSFTLLSRALGDLPVGTAYAVWVGIGAVGTAAVGMLWLGDPVTTGRLLSLLLVIAGVVGLQLTSGGPAS